MMTAQRWAGVIRRHDGRLFPVLGVGHQDEVLHLHINGAVVDFWATPAELYRRGYRLAAAKPAVWDLWGTVCVVERRVGGQAGGCNEQGGSAYAADLSRVRRRLYNKMRLSARG